MCEHILTPLVQSLGRGASRGTRVGAGWGIDLIWGEWGVLSGWQIVWWNTGKKIGDSHKVTNFDDVTHPFGDQNW